jgi:hypothetical protein
MGPAEKASHVDTREPRALLIGVEVQRVSGFQAGHSISLTQTRQVCFATYISYKGRFYGYAPESVLRDDQHEKISWLVAVRRNLGTELYIQLGGQTHQLQLWGLRKWRCQYKHSDNQ